MNEPTNIGEKIQTLALEAKQKFVIIAPFIKTHSLVRTLESLSPDLPLVCVTRWIAKEIATGVCDLEVMDVLKDRGNSELFLQPNLHAKLYRNENYCLIGSANLTLKALGWHSSSNLEFSYMVPSSDMSVVNFERLLFLTAYPATDQIRLETEENALVYADANSISVDDVIPTDIIVPAEWLPTCNRPESLYSIYNDSPGSTVLNSIVQSGQNDLNSVGLAPGLSEEDFRMNLRSFLAIHPVVSSVINNENSTFNEEEGCHIILTIYGNTPLTYSLQDHWIVLRRWLLYFFPELFREPHGSSLLQKGSELDSYRW